MFSISKLANMLEFLGYTILVDLVSIVSAVGKRCV
jgi:hypothetical protein